MKMQVRIALVVLVAALAVGWWSLRAKNAELEGKLAATPALTASAPPAPAAVEPATPPPAAEPTPAQGEASAAPVAPAPPTTDGGTP